MTDFEMSFRGTKQQLENPDLLRSLCRKEVESFEAYVRANDPWFRDGLVRMERLAIEGYIYQKVKGHIDAFREGTDLPEEGKNGA